MLDSTMLIELEKLIDKYHEDDVLKAFADICYSKADHAEITWQDMEGAKKWRRLGLQIYRTIDALSPELM